ncbi:unnamed protein product [Ophioblennius macclurei]
MDDVEIEDVNDDSPFLVEEPLKNQDLTSFTDVAGEVLSLYGWHLLLVAFIVVLLVQQLKKRRPRESEPCTAPAASQDAAFVARRQEAMEAARRKMQEDLDAKAVLFKEKQKQREEEKRRQKLENYEGIVMSQDEAASSSTALKPKTDKKPLRSTDYSPLSGQGGATCSWRPSRRGPSSGG